MVHRLQATGTVDGRQSTTTTSPSLRFTLGGDQAVLQAKDGAPGDGQPIATTDRSSVSISEPVPAVVPVLRWDVPMSVLRLLSAGLGVLALAALLLAARPRGTVAPERILARRLVRASNIDLGDRPVIDVDDALSLARLADLHEAVVLHVSRAPHDLYVVVADQAVYRLAMSSTSTSAAQRQRTAA